MADPVEILDYWLGEVGPKGWYAGGDALDADIRDRYLDLWQAAHDDGLEHWVDGAVGTLAYLIICDQFPRNIHRGHALSFSTDARARAAARIALDKGWDLNVPEPERQFFYMPFEHSENIDDQNLAVTLLTERLSTSPEMALHARAHREMITRYGRFPLRNAALGRENTPQEVDFIANGGYGALVNAMRGSHAEGA